MKALKIFWYMQCMFPCEDGMHLLMAGFTSIGYLRGKVGLRELSFESNASAVGCVNLNVYWLQIYSCFVMRGTL